MDELLSLGGETKRNCEALWGRVTLEPGGVGTLCGPVVVVVFDSGGRGDNSLTSDNQ